MPITPETILVRLADLDVDAPGGAVVLATPSVPALLEVGTGELQPEFLTFPFVDGLATVTLPPTDDPAQTDPTGYTWTLQILAEDRELHRVTGIPLAAGSGPVEFGTLVNLPEPGNPVYTPPAGGGSGVSDHGALTGLGDDDHPHYLTEARGDVRYPATEAVATALGSKVDTTDPRLSDARTPTAHDHDTRYYTETEVDTALSGKASTGHTHDTRYYTETEIDTALGSKVDTTDPRLSDARTPTTHMHDDRYYTEGEADTALASKASLAITRSGPRVMRPGFYYGPGAHIPGAGAATLNSMVAIPTVIPHAVTIDRIGLEVTTGVASAIFRLGIYLNDPATDLPAALLLEAGTVDASTTGVKEITISQALDPGTYWLAAVGQVAAASWRHLGNTSDPMLGWNTITSTANLGPNGQSQPAVSGALPNPMLPITGVSVIAPKIMIRAA
jgi:hypothetical protein